MVYTHFYDFAFERRRQNVCVEISNTNAPRIFVFIKVYSELAPTVLTKSFFLNIFHKGNKQIHDICKNYVAMHPRNLAFLKK